LISAFARGASGRVARFLFGGSPLSEVPGLLTSRFGLRERSDIQQVIDQAHEAMAAGRTIRSSSDDERQALSIVPINRFLGEAISEGDRVIHEIIVPWFDTSSDLFGEFFFRFTSDMVLTPAEIQARAVEFVDDLKNQYGLERFFGASDVDSIIVGNFEIPDVERRF